MSQAEWRRILTLLEEARTLAQARDERGIAELIQRARRGALERVYPASAPFVPLRKRPVKSKIA